MTQSEQVFGRVTFYWFGISIFRVAIPEDLFLVRGTWQDITVHMILELPLEPRFVKMRFSGMHIHKA